jgi:hypothetical protein
VERYDFFSTSQSISAEEGTRTPTTFRSPAPKAGASANSATSALVGLLDYTGVTNGGTVKGSAGGDVQLFFHIYDLVRYSRRELLSLAANTLAAIIWFC